jgi:hypothetical protein
VKASTQIFLNMMKANLKMKMKKSRLEKRKRQLLKREKMLKIIFKHWLISNPVEII